jgi:hypothetical protein
MTIVEIAFDVPGPLPDDWKDLLQGIAKENGFGVKSARCLPYGVRLSMSFEGASPSDESIQRVLVGSRVALGVDSPVTEKLRRAERRWGQAIMAVSTITVLSVLMQWVRFNTGNNLLWLMVSFGGAAVVLMIVAKLNQFGANIRAEFANAQKEILERINAAKSPEMAERTRLAKATISIRSNASHQELARLGNLVGWTFRMGGFFMLLTLAGPSLAIWIVSHADSVGWHYLLGSISVSAITLAAAVGLFRHDAKLRRHSQRVAEELAWMERLKIALDIAQGEEDEGYMRSIRRRAIDELINSGHRPVPVETSEDKSEELEGVNLVKQTMSLLQGK